MCFGKKKAKKKQQDKIVDMLKEAAGKGGVPSVPLDMSVEMLKSQSQSLKDMAGAIDEVTKGIKGEKMDMDKIKKAGQVDKKLKQGIEKGFAESIKGVFTGISKWIAGG